MKKIVALLCAVAVVFSSSLPFLDIFDVSTRVYAKPDPLNKDVFVDGAKVKDPHLEAVPAPGEVKIDGDFSDWDWSGRVKQYDNLEVIDSFYAEVASMWDSENLYLGFKFTDNSPLVGIYDPNVEAGWGWRNDSVQMRTVTDRGTGWITVTYNQDTRRGYFDMQFPDIMDYVQYSTDPDGVVLKNYMDHGQIEPAKIVTNAEICYKIWDDGKGYNMELKMPYEMFWLSTTGIGAGTEFPLGIELRWGDPTFAQNSEYTMNANGGGHSNPKNWKLVTLLPEGNIPMKEYVHPELENSAGTIHIPVKVPKHAKKLTIRVEDGKGTIIANAVSELDVQENILREEGDSYIVDAVWNGTDLYGYLVAPGEYTVTGIYHDGIVPYFDESAYNPGNPPWPSSTGLGSWGSDHIPPMAIDVIGNDAFIGYSNAESGTGLMRVDNDGKKLWGIKRGAEHMASANGYLYCLPGNDFYADTSTSGNVYLMRVDAQTGRFVPFVIDGVQQDILRFLNKILGMDAESIMPGVTGLAANEKYVVIATESANKKIAGRSFTEYTPCLNILNAEDSVLIKRIPLEGVGRIEFGKNGELYAESNGKIVEVNVETGKVTDLPIVEKEKDSFGTITVDKNGNILVFEKADRQIKAFTKTGALAYTIGKKGGRALEGYWEEDGLTHQVRDMAVDDKNQVWVVEDWNFPRRISVWNEQGFVKDFIGNPGYMSGGTSLHDTDPEKVYVGPNEMILDRETHTWRMNRVLYVPDISKGEVFPIPATGSKKMQHFRSDAGGKMNNYIFVATGSQAEGDNAPTVLYRENEDGTFQPCFATGRIDFIWPAAGYSHYTPSYDATVYRPNEEVDIKKVLPWLTSMNNTHQFVWNDWNNDGALQYDEFEFAVADHVNNMIASGGWGNFMTQDMEFLLWNSTGRGYRPSMLYKITPAFYTEDGIPRYTLAKSFKRIDTNEGIFFGENVLTNGGTVISFRTLGSMGENLYQRGVKCVDPETGEDLWWYHNPFPGVHGSHRSNVQEPGQVVGPIKLLGVVEASDKEVFMIRGNMGNDFIFTTDGYYVQTLFRDGRIPMLKLPDKYEDALGLDMSLFSENGEPFSGTFVKHSDGKYRLNSSTAGPTVIICTVEGLDTIKHIEPFKITLTKEQLEEADEFNNRKPTETEATVEEKEVNKIVKVKEPMKIDGSAVDWLSVRNDMNLSMEQVEENGIVNLAYDDENLYALFAVNDSTPMVNKGVDVGTLFKSGDVCDIQLSDTGNNENTPVEGDMRIILSVFEGKPVAVLMKQKTNGEKKEFQYASPVTRLFFDYVGVIEDAEISIARDYGGPSYILEAKIPLASIGLTATAGKKITGDVGIVTSDETGTANTARVYFFNKETGLVSDLPGEARLLPSAWGEMVFGE